MKIAVIYKSHYGATEIYAKWLAEDLEADLLKADKVMPDDFKQYDVIVYGGGIYAGKINGIAILTKNMDLIQDKELYLFTVGLADVTAPEALNVVRNQLEKSLSPNLMNKLHIYHLRGGMQFEKLSLIHRVMMRMLIKMLSNKPESDQSQEQKGMLEAISHNSNFINRMAIAPIVEEINMNKKL